MGMDFPLYGFTDRAAMSTYPDYSDLEQTKPNLFTFISAINKSQPIVSCQYELVWTRWPRVVFFAKKINIPGVAVNTVEINHAGFTVAVPTHVKYENTEITMTILADKEGFHYYDLRNMVLQTGHPLVAGDMRATIGNVDFPTEEDYIEVRLRNKPDDSIHHHWIIHNFHPKSIGDLDLSQDGSSFVEFDLTGTFTHITYDCGQAIEQEPEESQPSEDEVPPENDFGDDEDMETDYEEPYGQDEEGEEGEEGEDEEEEDYDDWTDYYDDEAEEEEPPLKKGDMIMSAEDFSIMRSEEDGTTIHITGSLNSNIRFGTERDSEPTKEECDLAKDYQSRLTDAQKELKKKIEEISKMPNSNSDNPDMQDQEDSWVNDFDGTAVDIPDKSQGAEVEKDENGNEVVTNIDGDKVDGAFSSAQIMAQSSPPLCQEQKDALKKALDEYSKKTTGIAQEYKEKQQELKEQQETQEFENKF